jgi:hypothetical protein
LRKLTTAIGNSDNRKEEEEEEEEERGQKYIENKRKI